jgi:putative flippase GtrA
MAMTAGRRFLRFNGVSLVGIGVQLATVAALTSWLDVPAVAASALGVSTAIVHNFAWHRRWTWVDRPTPGRWAAFARFAATNGAVSLVGTVAVVAILVDVTGAGVLVATAAGIAVSGLVNYWVSDRLVFR